MNRTEQPLLSVVIPVYKCGECLPELNRRLRAALARLTDNYEILYVNDGSPDDSWTTIGSLAAGDKRVKGIRLSRNFGQHIAITAGIDAASGDWIVVMDGDLQDRPEDIQRLWEKAKEGYDIVFARRAVRRDHWLKRWGSRLFYRVYAGMTDGRFDPAIANFSLCSRQVADELLKMRERSRSYPLFLKWLGFRWAAVDVVHDPRGHGRSSYSLPKLVNFAVDSIVSQSDKPLRLSIAFGFVTATASLIYGLYLIYKYFFLYQPVAGWTSVMVSLIFFFGLLFTNLGVLGLYIGKIFDEVKWRPLYVVRQTVGFMEIFRTDRAAGPMELTRNPHAMAGARRGAPAP